MKLTWSPLAIADREDIFLYIAADNPAAAVALDQRIQEKAALLIDYPRAGRVGRVEGTRELVAHRHYILIYDVQDDRDRVRILRVLHTARQWPPHPKRARVRKAK